MKGFVTNIEKATKENTDYRRVLYTSRYTQLVLMCLRPGEEIGDEVHGLDQFIRIEAGNGKAVLHNGTITHDLPADTAIIIPAGTHHNVLNVGDTDLKLYTLYSPPEHKDGTLEPTKADEVEEHFDGKTTE